VGDSFESDNTDATAKTIILGTTQTHSIRPAGDVDWVKFTLSVPSAVVVETSPGAANGDTEMWLYNSSLQLVRYSDDEGVGPYSYTPKSYPISFRFLLATTASTPISPGGSPACSRFIPGQVPGKVSPEQITVRFNSSTSMATQ
jgi:hypothetical protein